MLQEPSYVRTVRLRSAFGMGGRGTGPAHHGANEKARTLRALVCGRGLLRGPRYVLATAVAPSCFLVIGASARRSAARYGDQVGRDPMDSL